MNRELDSCISGGYENAAASYTIVKKSLICRSRSLRLSGVRFARLSASLVGSCRRDGLLRLTDIHVYTVNVEEQEAAWGILAVERIGVFRVAVSQREMLRM